MSQLRLGVFAAVLLLCFLIGQIPARVMAPFLPGGISMEGYSGTLWQGRVARAAVMISGKRFQLGRLDWSLSPWSLLRLEPTVAVDSQWGTQRVAGEVALGLGGNLSARNLAASLDVGFSRQLLPLYVGGLLQIDIKQLELLERIPEAIEGRLVWQDAVWTARAGDVALGNYVLDLRGDHGTVNGEVITLSGPLQVTGSVGLDAGQYSVALQLSGPATGNEGLRQSLALLAAPTPSGFDIRLDGAL